MRVTYDGEADAAYVYFREIGAGDAASTYACETDVQVDMINLDFDVDRRLIGIEILSASRSLPPELLSEAERIG